MNASVARLFQGPGPRKVRNNCFCKLLNIVSILSTPRRTIPFATGRHRLRASAACWYPHLLIRPNRWLFIP